MNDTMLEVSPWNYEVVAIVPRGPKFKTGDRVSFKGFTGTVRPTLPQDSLHHLVEVEWDCNRFRVALEHESALTLVP